MTGLEMGRGTITRLITEGLWETWSQRGHAFQTEMGNNLTPTGPILTRCHMDMGMRLQPSDTALHESKLDMNRKGQFHTQYSLKGHDLNTTPDLPISYCKQCFLSSNQDVLCCLPSCLSCARFPSPSLNFRSQPNPLSHSAAVIECIEGVSIDKDGFFLLPFPVPAPTFVIGSGM